MALAEAQMRPQPEIGSLGLTIPQMLRAAVARGANTALREKVRGIWRATSWAEYGEHAMQVGLGLVALGLKRGEGAAILASNRPEWVFCDMGIIGAGGVSVGVYETSAPAQVAYLLNDSRARYIFVENEEQLDKVLAVRGECPDLRRVIVYDMKGLRDLRDPFVLRFTDLCETGRRLAAEQPDLWATLNDAATPDDLALLIYTSGTTGPPKGAMISHRNVYFAVTQIPDVFPITGGDDHLSFLPACHVFERLFGVWLPLAHGVMVSFAEDLDTVPENLREVQPTIFAAVPRVWEKFYSAITLAVRDATPLQRWAYRAALALARPMADTLLAGEAPTLLDRLRFMIAYVTVLKNVRRMIGIDRCRLCLSGAAPISPDLLRWYRTLGLNIVEGYGMTETSGVISVTPPGRFKLGSVGRAMAATDVRIGDNGEILVRGDHIFRGYLNLPEKTVEAMADGWFRTGDVGAMDTDGFIRVTDRLKDVIITAAGKNITPSEIENELKFSPYISDAVVVGDRRPFLSCLIMIDADNVARFAQENRVPFTNYASLTQADAVVELIGKEIEAVNRKFARVETIRAFRLIDKLLSPEDEELTPTMKLKRGLVNTRYASLIETMYRT